MKSNMKKTLKILYPDDFGKRKKKVPKQGFIKRRITKIKMFFSTVPKPKLIIGSVAIWAVMCTFYSVYVFNHFTTHLNNIYTAGSNLDKETQRRNDLINNLIPTAMKYLNYEKNLFSEVAKIRKQLSPLNVLPEGTVASDIKVPENLGKMMSSVPSLTGIFENYPDLKASTPFADLMKALIETENRIARARDKYNENVNIYNTYITRLPASMVAKTLKYEQMEWFSATKNSDLVPDLNKLN